MLINQKIDRYIVGLFATSTFYYGIRLFLKLNWLDSTQGTIYVILSILLLIFSIRNRKNIFQFYLGILGIGLIAKTIFTFIRLNWIEGIFTLLAALLVIFISIGESGEKVE